MTTPVAFDHIEAHVTHASGYAEFLLKVFRGGEWRVIDDHGTVVFFPPKGIPIEIKSRRSTGPLDTEDPLGFCMPCIRLAGAERHITEALGCKIIRVMTNDDGKVFFFRDHEGVNWHVKDYSHEDRYVRR